MLRNSRILRLWYIGLWLVSGLACLALWERHYSPWVWTAVLPLLTLLRHLHPPDYQGCALVWEAGQWYWQTPRERHRIELQRRRIRLPWLLYMCWRQCDTHGRVGLWLFNDSASRVELAHLRRRLCLQRAVVRDQDSVPRFR